MSDENYDGQLEAILEMTGAWYGAFAKSPGFSNLSDSHQQEAGAITEFFASHTYEHLDLRPREWNRRAVVKCCTDILPRKVSAKSSFFEAIAPVLSAFFRFLHEQSLLSNGHALADVVEKLGEKIVANSKDRSTWGPAKGFVMAAQDAGVDIQDQAALEAFMMQCNLQQATRSQFADAVQPLSPFARIPELQPRGPKFSPPPSRYDPCPCGSGQKYKFCCERQS